MHSFYMLQKNKFIHEDETVKTHEERLQYYKVTDYTISGENIGGTICDGEPLEIAEELVHGWMESEGHRKNILDPRYKETGVGIMEDFGDTFLATQVFIG